MKNDVRVVIKNFQSIKETSFLLSGFTVIQGESGIGKSAIVRAIDCALNNSFKVTDIRHGESEIYVMLHFLADDFKIEAFRNKAEAWYIINDDKENPYNKLNRSVPPPVIEYGLKSFTTRGNKTYFPQVCSNQHDTHFFIFDDDSNKAELLSEISNTTQTVEARALAFKDLKAKKSSIKVQEKALEALLEKKKEVDEYCLKDLIKESEGIISDLKEKAAVLSEKKVKIGRLLELQELSSLYNIKLEEVSLREVSAVKDTLSEKIKKVVSYEKSIEFSEVVQKNLKSYEEVFLKNPLDLKIKLDKVKDYSLVLREVEELSSLSLEEVILGDPRRLMNKIKTSTRYSYLSEVLIPLLKEITSLECSIDFSKIQGLSVKVKRLMEYEKLKEVANYTPPNLLKVELPVGFLGFKGKISKVLDYKEKLSLLSMYSQITSLDDKELTSIESMLSQFREKLSRVEDYLEKVKEVKTIEETIVEIDKERERILEEVASYKVCPLCSNPLKEGHCG